MPPHCFEVLHDLAGCDAGENLVLRREQVGRNNQTYRLADDLVRGIPVQSLRRWIPGGDDAVAIEADDGVVRRVDDGGETRGGIRARGHERIVVPQMRRFRSARRYTHNQKGGRFVWLKKVRLARRFLPCQQSHRLRAEAVGLPAVGAAHDHASEGWRRGRDSNPRAGYPARRFRGAPVTTTSVPLRIRFRSPREHPLRRAAT